MAEKHTNAGGMFLRLANDGDKVVGAFCGEPDAREVHWTGETYAECAGAGCPHCAEGKATMRVTINFWVAAENAMKVMEGGTTWFRDVLNVRDKYGLDKWTFEVKRVGKPKDPKTKYTILPEQPIDDAIRKRIASCPLHELTRIGRGDAADCPPTAHAPSPTVDVGVANELLAELKTLPRTDADAFLAAFRITRVRELRACDVDDARAFLAKRRPPAADDGHDGVPFF